MSGEPEFDYEAMLEVLAEEGVEYLIIGGIAAGLYGGSRNTQDLDILPAPGRENAERLARALARLRARLKGVDADLLGIDPTDPEQLASGANFTLVTDCGDLDVMSEVEGGRPWEQLAVRAASMELRPGLRISVVGRDDLIAMKRASGRRRDIEDIVQLTSGQHRAAAPAVSLVRLSATLRPEAREDEVLAAADAATAAFEREVRFWVDGDTQSERRLRLEARLDGFGEKHARTWASIVAGRLETAGLLDGEVHREVSS